jgi:hypothetical protein
MESFISAGFLLVRKMPRQYWMGESLLPEYILSASYEICPQFPGTYCIEWVLMSEEKRQQQFERIGLSPHLWAHARQWATTHVDSLFGWPGVFYNLEDARQAKQFFFPADEQMYIIGLGLAKEFITSFLQDAAPHAAPEGYAPIGSAGYYELVQLGLPMPEEGTFLGFELLNTFLGALEFSWLVNDLHRYFAKVLDIRPGSNGLLENLAQARLCCQEIAKDESIAESGVWLPWALFSYEA